MISAMKRFLPLLAALLLGLSFFSRPPSAAAYAAEGRFAVAAREDVWFYAAEDEESGLFLVPYTYYVRVLREGTLYTAVQYLDDAAPYRAVTGFCKTEMLTFVDFIPERPFLKKEITLTYTLDAENAMGKGAFDKIERTFLYYGTSYAGTARYFYVYSDGVFDYVPAMQDIVYEHNTDYLEPVSGEPEKPPAESASPSALQIAAICAAVLVPAAIAFFVLRGKKPSPAEEF